jgi:hypothetical protein
MRTAAHLVGRRVSSVVLIVEVARDIEQAAVRRGHPEVGAACVEDDLEFLRWRAQANLSVILHTKHSYVSPACASTQSAPTDTARDKSLLGSPRKLQQTCASRKFFMGTSAPPLACCSRCCIVDGRRLAIGAMGPFFREIAIGSAVHVATDSNAHSATAATTP